MATEINAVGLHRCDRACGIDGSIALNQNHARHVSGNEPAIIRARRRRAALRRNKAVALQLVRELLQRGRLKSGENERRFNRLECRARRQTGPRGGFTGEPELPVVAKNSWGPLRRLIGPPDRVRNRVEQLAQHTGARVHGDAVVDRFRGTLKGDTPVKTSERRRRGVHVDRSREAFAAGEQIIDAE